MADAGKAHLLRKKRPQHLAKLRRVGCVDDAELDTYQRLLLVFPKCARLPPLLPPRAVAPKARASMHPHAIGCPRAPQTTQEEVSEWAMNAARSRSWLRPTRTLSCARCGAVPARNARKLSVAVGCVRPVSPRHTSDRCLNGRAASSCDGYAIACDRYLIAT